MLMQPSPLLEQKLSIGRGPANDCVAAFADVSTAHAFITCLSEHIFLLEDRNSTNGTYVNQRRIKRAICTREDQISLGTRALDVNQLFPLHQVQAELNEKFAIPPASAPVVDAPAANPNDYSQEFAQLEAYYALYKKAKFEIQNKGQLQSGLLRLAPAAVLTGLLMALHLQEYAMLGTALGGMLGVCTSGSISPSEKIDALEEDFKINYVCPKCRLFFGPTPWLSLALKKNCDRCKAIWVAH